MITKKENDSVLRAVVEATIRPVETKQGGFILVRMVETRQIYFREVEKGWSAIAKPTKAYARAGNDASGRQGC